MQKPPRILAMLVAAAGSLAGCAALNDRTVAVEPNPMEFGQSYPDDLAAAGRAIAQEHCATCHAVGHESKSPKSDAPPFSTLLSTQNADALTDKLVAGISNKHRIMPRFRFNLIAAGSLVAYLEQLGAQGDQRTPVE